MLGLSPWLALPLSFLIGILLGLVVERTLMRPLYSGYTSWGSCAERIRRHHHLRASIFLINLVDKIVGPYAFKGPALIDISRITIGRSRISGHRLIAALVAVAVIVGTAIVMRYTFWGGKFKPCRRTGSALRLPASTPRKQAPSSSRSRAGLPPFPAHCSPISLTRRRCRRVPAIKSYVIVVLAAWESYRAASLRAFVLGVLESFGGVYIPISTATHSVSSF